MIGHFESPSSLSPVQDRPGNRAGEWYRQNITS